MKRISQLAGLAALISLLAGCATVDIDRAVQATNRATSEFTNNGLELSRTEQQRQARRQLSEQLLAQPLTMDGAVQLALANSPALQALIAQSWSDMAAANQAGRIANPVFTFERLREGHEAEIGRLLSIGLLDLITLPRRQAIARNQEQQANTQLSIGVVEQVSQVRRDWVRAVAAQQTLMYAQQVKQSAEAAAELARRMEQVGNFTKLQRARQHSFYVDAATQLAVAQQAATSAREELARVLGLNNAQLLRLKLPERLPDLPSEPRAEASVTAAASQQRLDIQLARLQLEVAGKVQGLNLLNSLIDMELGVRHDTVMSEGPSGQRDTHDGYELSMRLPIFDWGDAQRAAMNAQSLAAANRYDNVVLAAASNLRQSYSSYRTAYDIARHYRDEVVPLRKTISDQNMLRYNGMLIGVFELLADARDQIASVMGAINALQQFWLADAGLSSSVIGRPLPLAATPVSTSTASNGEAAH